ncbi:MAG: hypothetical protein AB8B72_11045 [Crocinitomicaceae bacterium]
MSIKTLSWNMYYGSVHQTTPCQRFNRIMTIANTFQVDLVFLQEHPGLSSQLTDQTGRLHGISPIPSDYNYHVIPEMDHYITDRVSASNRAYALLIKNTCQLSDVGYFNQSQFVNHPKLRSYLRCPVHYKIKHLGITYNIFNWHNEIGNLAKTGMKIFTRQTMPNNTILLGDLNLTVNQINRISFFNHWYDIVVNTMQIHGVDHILSKQLSHPVLGNVLDFTSDANHFPIAGDI